jgi:hypothetical protein
MERKSVASSAIAEVGYDPETKVLEVGFPSKAVWRYADVPQEVFDKFMRAESLGRFFASDIRANYKAERVHIEGCHPQGLCDLGSLGVCGCWCHHITKGSSHAESAAKELGKAIGKNKPRKDKKAI